MLRPKGACLIVNVATAFRNVGVMKSILCSVCLAIIMASLSAQTPSGDKPPFTLTLSAPQPTVKLGDPIMIHIVLKSVSQKQFPLPSDRNVGLAELNYRIDVETFDGKPVPDTEIGRKFKTREEPGSRSVLIRHMNFGDEEAQDSNLNNVVKITSPGNYVVRVERDDDLYRDLHVKSNILVIHVTP
jgi:hypothetical protein